MQAGHRIDRVIDVRHVLRLAPDAVLGTEERRQFPAAPAWSRSDGVAQIAGDCALIGDRPIRLPAIGCGSSSRTSSPVRTFIDHGCSHSCAGRAAQRVRDQVQDALQVFACAIHAAGKFTISAVPRVAACARESGAIGVFAAMRAHQLAEARDHALADASASLPA